PATGNLQSRQPEKPDKPQIQKPTAPNPAPPELIPDERDAYAVVTSPDVCRSPKVPIPYMSWGKADDKLSYSPDVRANGKIIKLQTSKFSCCYGDEPGVGKGVKSGTVGDVVEPVTSSTIVRANGQWVQRDTDRCTLNRGNAPGEYVYVKSTDTHKAPDGADAQDRAWYDRTWDGFYDNSDEAQLAGGAINKGKQYWNDPSRMGSDLQSVWNARPSVSDVVNFGKDVSSGIANTADYVWNNPGQSAQNVANWTGDAVKSLWTGVTNAYDKGGVAQAGGHLAATALGIANPLKKAEAAGEGLELASDVAKAQHRLKEAEEAARNVKALENKAEQGVASGDGGVRNTSKTRTKNPCDHLAKGNPNGKGPYRGGSYGGVPGSEKLGIESHHMPAKSAYPEELSNRVGGINRMPAMQMKRDDHRETKSHGWQGSDGEQYRADQKSLMETGRYRDAQAMDFRDARRIAREAGDTTKYNEAMLETAAYRKCLEHHGLLPGKGK
ncbi:DUF4150 domain-containing protein, partial [Rhizobium sp. FKY42]|uniref:DUF4150 domain-containing protein n=1 Tax=Rhizobium sp. FKY42 TaxID=2562310 RepID=UPI001FF06F1F